MKENSSAVNTHISLKNRWKHLPRKKHRTIGNVLFVLIIPLCLVLLFAAPVLSWLCVVGILGYQSEVVKLGFTTNFLLAHLALSIVLACGLLRLYWTLLVYLVKRFFEQSSRHCLTLYLIQDAANRGIYESSYRKYQERVESLETSYQSRIDRLYSENAGAEVVSEVRDENSEGHCKKRKRIWKIYVAGCWRTRASWVILNLQRLSCQRYGYACL